MERREIRCKRAYEAAEAGDGLRVLVDRVWPRGLTKEAARIDLWLREAAPSTGLRKWFGHDPARWEEFRRRYREELKAAPAGLERLRELAREHKIITLIYGARDTEHNQAAALRELLKR